MLASQQVLSVIVLITVDSVSVTYFDSSLYPSATPKPEQNFSIFSMTVPGYG